jgi:hypothetical protein
MPMLTRRRMLGFLAVMLVAAAVLAVVDRPAQAAGQGQPYDWNRFNYYPYVYYPHNFQAPVQYDNMYYRYPAERRIPVYNSNWHNFYPTEQPYHSGHAFILDVF